MNRRMLIVLSVCLVLFGGIFGFKAFVSRMMTQAFDNMPQPPATVSATTVRQESWPSDLAAVGTLRAVAETDVTTEASGIVERIEFQSGDPVAAGAVLVTLDSSTDRAQLSALEAQERLAEQELERIKQLYERRVSSKADLDSSDAQAASARANVEAQRARIAQKVIRAPFAGVLGIRKIDLGQYLSPGTPIVTLQALDEIYVDFRLPQQLLGQVQEGQHVNVMIEAFGDQSFGGVIAAIEAKVDVSTRNFLTRATLANAEHMLKPGMFARIEISLGAAQDVLVVPQTAVSYNPYGDSVWVIQEAEGGSSGLIAQRRVVKTGRRRGDLVDVTQGLSAGEQVATSGLLKLRNGVTVLINNDVQPSADLAPTPPNS
jgi:membrane fusion protein, multidrug efflux system